MNEDDTARDGTLSYSKEWHALGYGIYYSLLTLRPVPGLVDYARDSYDDVDKEPHYYVFGFILGSVIQYLLALTAVAVVVVW